MISLLSQIKCLLRFKHLCFLFICLSVSVSCGNLPGDQNGNALTVKTPVVQNDLEKRAARLIELYDNKNCKEFINSFPVNFQEFYQLYGFDGKKGAHPLYSKTEHITYFFDCPEVSEREKLEKIIKIGIDGKWDADNIGLFQGSALKLVKAKPNETIEILNNLSDEKAASFWYFLVDSAHPNDRENVQKIESLINLIGKDGKQGKLLSEQYQKIQADRKDH